MRTQVLLLCVIFVLSALAERQPYERYQTIVDRQMFGPPPADFDPTKMPSEVAKTKAKADQELTKEQEQVKKAIKFSVLNVTPAGETVVGFSDNGDPKNPLHYYLKVGESQNGWTVKEADREAATMTIVNQEGIEVTLKLGGDSASNAAAVTRAGAAASNEAGRGSALFGGLRSLRERRRMQQEQAIADQARREAADKAREQQEAEERKQREAEQAEERKQHEAERAEQREQLLRIQEELRKVREQREAQKSETAESEPESE